ncbi:hypothetical protein AALP_AAs40899U000100, partial [Arabis alpina]
FSTIRHAFLIFSILVSVAVTQAEAATTATYNPTDVFLFTCGDTFNGTDDTGRNWTAEDPKTFPSNSENASFPAYENSLGPSVLLVPYKGARVFQSDFTYSFSVSPRPKFIRLYFYPTQYGFGNGYTFFSVTVSNGFALLKNFSADLAVNPAANDFTLTRGRFDDKIANVSSTIDFEIGDSVALETVYRINIGGDMDDDVGT